MRKPPSTTGRPPSRRSNGHRSAPGGRIKDLEVALTEYRLEVEQLKVTVTGLRAEVDHLREKIRG